MMLDAPARDRTALYADVRVSDDRALRNGAGLLRLVRCSYADHWAEPHQFSLVPAEGKDGGRLFYPWCRACFNEWARLRRANGE